MEGIKNTFHPYCSCYMIIDSSIGISSADWTLLFHPFCVARHSFPPILFPDSFDRHRYSKMTNYIAKLGEKIAECSKTNFNAKLGEKIAEWEGFVIKH